MTFDTYPYLVFHSSLLLLLVFTSSIQAKHIVDIEEKGILLKSVVENQLRVHGKPISTWFLINSDSRNSSLSDFSGEFCDEEMQLLEYLLQSFHRLTSDMIETCFVGDKLVKSFRSKHVSLTSFQMIIPVCPANIDEQMEKVNRNGSKRKDHYIFLSKEESTLLQVFQDPVVIKRKEKMGIAWNPFTIFEEPKVFDASGKSLTRYQVDETNPIQWKPRIQRRYLGQNLAGRHIRISASILPPYFFIKPENDPNSMNYFDGNHYRIFSETYQQFNYTFEVSSTPVGEGYGDLLPNGTWTGMIAKVYYEEHNYDAVIILGPLIVWYDMFDFVGSMGVAQLLFLTSHPTLELSSEAFLNPYTKAVWIGTVVSYFSVAVTLRILLGLSRNNNKNNDSIGSEPITALNIAFAIALEQSGAKIKKNLRILTGIWMIATIITGTGYKCNLASYLSFPTAISVPTNYEELAARKDYQIKLNNIGAAEVEFFVTSEGATVQSLRRRMELIPDPVKCATEALVNLKTVCIAWCPFMTLTAAGALTLDTKRSPLLFSKQGALTTSISVAFQKDSVYADAFIPITQILYEAGLYTRWESEAIYYHKQIGRGKMLSMKDSEAYKRLSSYEESLNKGPVNPFTVENLKFSFYLIVFAAIIGSVGLLCEFLYKDFWDK